MWIERLQKLYYNCFPHFIKRTVVEVMKQHYTAGFIVEAEGATEIHNFMRINAYLLFWILLEPLRMYLNCKLNTFWHSQMAFYQGGAGLESSLNID